MFGHGEFGSTLGQRLRERESQYQQIEEGYIAFCSASKDMKTQQIKEVVNDFLYRIRSLRATGQTVQEKKEATIFLEKMLKYFDSSRDLSALVRHMFSDSHSLCAARAREANAVGDFTLQS